MQFTVGLYVKESLYYKRRSDLESDNLECIWIEIILRNKRVLFGTFYRPPNSDSTYYSLLEVLLMTQEFEISL